jgi:hypothetical protein
MFGIERAWINQGSVGPRPRQIYLTKSPLLAEKVEEEYLGLWLSHGVDSDSPEYVCEHRQRWNTRKKINALTAVNLGGARDDLPQRFSELHENHFPLFITTATVSTILGTELLKPIDMCSSYLQLCSLLEEDIERDDSSEGRKLFLQRKKLRDSRKHLVTPDVFKREYWPHLNQGLTKGIGMPVLYACFSTLICLP